MREVSCKAVEPFLRAADVRNIGRETLLTGVGYTLDHVQDSHERIDYDSFLRFIANIRLHFTDDDIVNIGATGLEGTGVRTILTIGRLIMSPTGFYRWMLAKGGVGNQMFNNLVPVFKELEPGHFNVEVRWAPGYQPCPEFLLMSKGGMQAAARLLGLGKDASVEVRFTEVGGVIEVRVPTRRTFRGWLFSRLGTKRDVLAAGAQLEDANTALERRYVELQKAQAAIEQQRLALDHAYRLGHQIWGELDVDTIAGIVAREIGSLASVIGARVALQTPTGRTIVGKSGSCNGESSVSVSATGGQATGTLAVWSTDPNALVAIRSVVELVAPTVSTAIENALAHDELTSHRRDLESVVAKRTSELTMARDALAGNVEELRAAQVARDIFFANINHEFRAPLSLIALGLADLQTRIGNGLDEGATRSLDSVGGSARRLLRLVDEILLLAMGTEVGPRVKPVPTDVVEVVRQLVLIWQPAIDAHHHTLQLSLPQQLAALVDPSSFEWMVTNLLSNAIKYTPDGGTIGVTLEREANNVVLRVCDTGIGIEAGLVERLFTRGARGERGSSQRGSGIGLAVVHQLAEAHRGSVSASPRPEGGTEFRLVLPIAIVEAERLSRSFVAQLSPDDYDVGLPPVVSGQVFSPARTSLGTILVAEDGARMALRIAEVLGDEYTVVVALNGTHALELAITHQPHLLVTDVDMPGMTGIELAREFRALAGDQLAPVLILSAFGDLASRIEGLDAGALDYMVKPFDGRELKARVRAQFRMRDLSMRLSRSERLATAGTLAAGLAHELRNPTNGVVNAIVPLRELLPPELAFGTAPTAQLFEVVVACTEQISAVCRHLLDFGGARSLVLAVIKVEEILARARMLARDALDGIELRFDAIAISQIPALRISGALMAQVLANLLENAGHAAGPGGWVQFRATISDGRTTLEVSDSGPGISAALRERVFEPFFTTKAPGVGTGLGLSIARDIVHRHHGVLEIREHAGRPCFVIDLPSPATHPSLEQSKHHDDA